MVDNDGLLENRLGDTMLMNQLLFVFSSQEPVSLNNDHSRLSLN